MTKPKKPKVLNRRKHKQTGERIHDPAVYVGRPSKWGNPFEIGRDGDRAHVIMKYRDWLSTQRELMEDIKEELRGKDLICWCAPQPCHAEVLMEIANDE